LLRKSIRGARICGGGKKYGRYACISEHGLFLLFIGRGWQ
jgi:hypothetical protein